jgi:hypothetical protein
MVTRTHGCVLFAFTSFVLALKTNVVVYRDSPP